MTYGFLTLENKNNIFNLLKPVIKERYDLELDYISGISVVYNKIAKSIHKDNQTLDIVEKNKILVKTIIDIYKYHYNIKNDMILKEQQEQRQQEQEQRQQKTNEEKINEEEKNEEEINEETNDDTSDETSDETNEILGDSALNYDDINSRIEELKADRDKEIENIMNQNSFTNNNTNFFNKDKKEIKQKIIRLDSNIAFQINQNEFNSTDTIYIKKLLFPSIVSNNDICQSSFVTVTNENKDSIFFNMGIYGGCYRFETDYELGVNIKNKLNTMFDIKLPSGDNYKQTNILMYVIY